MMEIRTREMVVHHSVKYKKIIIVKVSSLAYVKVLKFNVGIEL